MFREDDLKCLDPEYFVILVADPYDVSIMSKNTGHYWYLHNPEYPEDGTTEARCRITSTAGRTT